MAKRVIDIEEKVPILEAIPLSLQHLFAMFGASVLVPYLFNQAAQKASGDPTMQVIDPSLVLLLNGIGTLIYLILCKGKAPAFLGSSFAFISPTISVIISSSDYKNNFAMALGGYIASGLVFATVALIIGKVGTKWLDVILPPAAMGAIVALIGLELAGTAAGMAGFLPDANGSYSTNSLILSIATLLIVIFGSLMFRGFLAIIPVLVAVLAGYGLAAVLNIYNPGVINYAPIGDAKWFNIPEFVLPVFEFNAVLIILPAALVVIAEHIGHLFVTGNIVGRDLIKDPGLHRSMLGDGLSTMLSGCSGSVPTTTYGENMGVMAITKVYSVWVIGGAAVISILLAFIGKLSAVISSIPVPVMGGICILLFGVIAASGIRMLVESKIDYSKSKNLIITAIVFIVGISGAAIKIGTIELKGMALATIVAIVFGTVLTIFDKLKLLNEEPYTELKIEPDV